MIRDGMNREEWVPDSFLMLGQSNMAGRGDLGEVKPIRNPLCFMLRMGRWQPMCEPVNPDRGIFEGRFRSGVSLAASFADDYARHYRRPVGLIPCADGGTTLEQWQKGQLNYDHALLQGQLALRTSRLKGILWHQGESDCQRDETVEAYYPEFCRMITQLRRDLGMPELPVILGQLPQTIGPSWKTQGREATLNGHLERIARELPHCAIASSRGLSTKADGIHFDSESCRELGKRYFLAYLSLQ